MSVYGGNRTCAQITQRQQKLLMQCFCHKLYNTQFVKYHNWKDEVVCTRDDRTTHIHLASEVCRDYRRYNCPGVKIGPVQENNERDGGVHNGSYRVSAGRLMVLGMLAVSCLIM
ncbi:hypothetical protein EC988_003482 [Linderina pennispora]|nr:hypothetical protein EC988_003482 [Linderina pennispora]